MAIVTIRLHYDHLLGRTVCVADAHLVVDFMGHLGSHASGHGVVEQIGNPVDKIGKLPKTGLNDSRNAAETGQELQAVVDADESVITRIRSQVVLLHRVVAGRRHRREVAEAAFHEGTEIRAVLLATRAGLDAAAHVELTLEARVLGHIILQDLSAQ
eukprot:CAMPEP_0184983056 /NCGR_PEP_ID=MMETSP1098-20130426/12410_1 /TAXON_ID=89044 /ORGANISM="Spumella elongata, Strain CCAP 955/1" /LENGTH=156 /DNA_ID=CAMNT_0027506847 /DNA_START=302 /DNA_END=772 /DNA_ORIENTATION=-